MTTNDDIMIIDYQPQHQEYFERFNREWITRYFEMEPLDVFILTNPEDAILKNGGAILMAVCNNEVAGTIALIKINATTFELAKMAVDSKFQRKGIARALCISCFEKARQLGAETLILYSNSVLQPALKLYEDLGFQYLHDESGEYKRADIKMSIKLNEPASNT